MNIAFLAQSTAFRSFQNLVTGFSGTRAPIRPMVRASASSWRTTAPTLPHQTGATARPNPQTHRTQQRPLRVVRVVEVGQGRSDVGRMVISGRMADVCAELDRLVAREAA